MLELLTIHSFLCNKVAYLEKVINISPYPPSIQMYSHIGWAGIWHKVELQEGGEPECMRKTLGNYEYLIFQYIHTINWLNSNFTFK
jgi:hypothetical protein